MQDWTDMYDELSEKVAGLEAIKWVDLWHNQVGFLEDEHRFPTPAVFFSFRSAGGTEDMAEKMQNVRVQVEVYLYYETMADTFHGSVNKQSAKAFLNLLKEIYILLHGTTGNTYNEMRRTGFSPVDTGSAGNLYQQVFECSQVELAAKKVYFEADTVEMEVERGTDVQEAQEYELPLFQVHD